MRWESGRVDYYWLNLVDPTKTLKLSKLRYWCWICICQIERNLYLSCRIRLFEMAGAVIGQLLSPPICTVIQFPCVSVNKNWQRPGVHLKKKKVKSGFQYIGSFIYGFTLFVDVGKWHLRHLHCYFSLMANRPEIPFKPAGTDYSSLYLKRWLVTGCHSGCVSLLSSQTIWAQDWNFLRSSQVALDPMILFPFSLLVDSFFEALTSLFYCQLSGDPLCQN